MDGFVFQKFAGCLSLLDMTIIVSAVAMLFVISYAAGKRQSDTAGYFLGNRRVPAIVACLSFVATEVSAVTIVGVPAAAYGENWQYLQFFIGSAAARIFVAFWFLPVFYKFDCTSIYEFLRHRFNPQTQYAGAAFFFITRLVGSGVRLYAACFTISFIIGFPLAATLAVFTAVSIIFIALGGIKAVVWAGAYQAAMFFAAGAAVVIYLIYSINVDTLEIYKIAAESGRLSVFNFKFNLNDPTTFWAGTANAFFIGLAVFGTDQELVQRLLTVKTRRTSQKTIIATIFASLPLLCLYLSVGTLLFVFYKTNTTIAPPGQDKEVLSHFVVNVLPVGLKGLLLAAVILASIDSPLAALSSSFVYDIYRPVINRRADEKHYLFVSRAGVMVFGLILAAIAFACQPVKSILWFAFGVVSITGGATLGIFLFGILVKKSSCNAEAVSRNSGLANIAAMTISSLSMAALFVLSHYGIAPIAWSWLIVLGTIITFCLVPLIEKIILLACRPVRQV